MSTRKQSQRKAAQERQRRLLQAAKDKEKEEAAGGPSEDDDDEDPSSPVPSGSDSDSDSRDSPSTEQAEAQTADEEQEEEQQENSPARKRQKSSKKDKKEKKRKRKSLGRSKEKAKREETDKANIRQVKEAERQQLLKQRPSSVCELVTLKNVHTQTRKGSRTDGKEIFNCKVTVPPNSPNWIKKFAELILMNTPDIKELGADFEDWATMQGTYGRQDKDKNMEDASRMKYEATRAEQVKTMKQILAFVNYGSRLDTCSRKELHIGTGYLTDEDAMQDFRTTLQQIKGLSRVPASMAFYDFGPTTPVLRTLTECNSRCAAMHATYEAQDRLVKALLGQTSMAEFATNHMALAAQVLRHYSFIGCYIIPIMRNAFCRRYTSFSAWCSHFLRAYTKCKLILLQANGRFKVRFSVPMPSRRTVYGWPSYCSLGKTSTKTSGGLSLMPILSLSTPK